MITTITFESFHIIVAHEVVNVGHDRSQLAAMAELARDAIGENQMTVFIDRGYFKSDEILQCEQDYQDAGPETADLKQQGRGSF